MREKILQVVADVFEINIAEIPENASPGVIANWDSLRHMNLIVALEEEFKITFNDNDIPELITIPLIEAIIKELLPK